MQAHQILRRTVQIGTREITFTIWVHGFGNSKVNSCSKSEKNSESDPVFRSANRGPAHPARWHRDAVQPTAFWAGYCFRKWSSNLLWGSVIISEKNVSRSKRTNGHGQPGPPPLQDHGVFILPRTASFELRILFEFRAYGSLRCIDENRLRSCGVSRIWRR